jgi:hypothetical protein
MDLHSDFNKFMVELKGPDWNAEAPKFALKGNEDRLSLEYSGKATCDISAESLSKNVGTNQSLRSNNNSYGQKVLAIKDVEQDNLTQTKFKGSNNTIKIEKVTMLDANGNPVGTEVPMGAVTNPIMNPIYAAMYLPYLASYNSMMLNPNAYYSAIPQGIFTNYI